MPTIEITFEPWRSFMARKKDEVITSWLHKVGTASEAVFRSGSASSGRPSPGGGWPAIVTGALLGSLHHEVKGAEQMDIGTSMEYSRYLRYGTSKMDFRKMSEEALHEGIGKAGRLTKWVEWTRE